MRQWHVGATRGFGRTIIDHDPRNLAWPAKAVLFDPTKPLETRTHRRGQAYDQGSTPQCVAYTGKGLLNTDPFDNGVDYDVRSEYKPQSFYRWAQHHDEWPGVAYDGTSARGLGRALRNRGFIRNFRWCFGIEEVLHCLSQYGPVGIGGNWLSGMTPDDFGVLRYTGTPVGGHEWEAIGIDVENKTVVAMNSWGEEWGDRGRFHIPFNDLDMLLQDAGDAVTFVMP